METYVHLWHNLFCVRYIYKYMKHIFLQTDIWYLFFLTKPRAAYENLHKYSEGTPELEFHNDYDISISKFSVLSLWYLPYFYVYWLSNWDLSRAQYCKEGHVSAWPRSLESAGYSMINIKRLQGHHIFITGISMSVNTVLYGNGDHLVYVYKI